MITLRTLGTIDLVDDSGARIDALLRRPKRLALLAYLAMARPGATLRREKLLALFWPEIDEARARGSLRQSVHVLRQHLGASALVALGDEALSLNDSIVCCDAMKFERAVGEGRLADAMDVYGGEFLPGFFLDGADDFQEWVELARSRLRERASAAATQLAEQAWSAGEYSACIEASRRAIAIAPGDERATRRLIAALDRTGERGGAICAYDALAQRLEADFNVRPSAETQALVAAVRARERAAVVPSEQVGSFTPLVKDTPPARRLSSWPRPIEQFARTMLGGALMAAVLLLSGSRPRLMTPVPVDAVPKAAVDAYLRARFYIEQPTEANLRKAMVLFERSLDAEPLYAPANAGLGDVYLRLGYGSYLAPSEAFPKAIAAAQRAIELDSLAPEAHATLAFAHMYYDWDRIGAEREFRLAIRLAPRYALAHEWYAYLLIATGRDAEARAESDIAQRLAPLSVAAAVDGGLVSFYAGDLKVARQRLDGALLMAPEVPLAHFWLGRVAQRENDLAGARAEYAKSGALRNWVPTIAAAAYVDASLGDEAAGRAALVRLDSIAHDRYVTPYAVALVHAALHEPDEAFRWLDSAVADRSHWLVWLERDNRWAPIRADPRFAALVRRVGL